MMKRNILNLIVLLFILGPLTFYGCAVAVLGIGAAGAGAAYFNGKLTKTYEEVYHDIVQASRSTLEDLKIPMTETITDELKTEIKAKRTDGTPVVIEIIRIEHELTQVSVRTGALGIWDKRVSEQIHGYIGQNLNKDTTKGEKSSENFAQDEIQTPFGEVVESEIIEEDLENTPSQETAHTKPTANLDSRAQPEMPSQFSGMTTDSIFIIFFKQNSNDLSEEAIKKLDQVFEILINNPNTEITLNGYSDSIGVASYNEMISEIRANAVKSYLIGKGIAPFRMTAVGHGSKKFIASNKSAEGRQLNRRVEIEINNP